MYQLTSGNSVINLGTGACFPLPPNESEGFAYQAWLDAGNTPLPAPVPTLPAYQKTARARIDSDVDGVYYAVIGDRTTEYQQANSDATAFKNAGYLGTVPASVQCWATAKGWTAQQAADDILTTAANWLGAQQSMRANRLARKQDVTAATTLAGVDAAVSTWATYIAGMRVNLGL